VDVSGNRLDESDAAVLQRAVAGNEVLTSLDVRGNAGIADKRCVGRGLQSTAVAGHLSRDLRIANGSSSMIACVSHLWRCRRCLRPVHC
jgi:hypothetical protein